MRGELGLISEQVLSLYTHDQKYIEFFFNQLLQQWESTIFHFRNEDISIFYKFVKYHRCRRNGHGTVPLNNEQRFKFAMSSYTRAAHHCDQRWTSVLAALRDSHSDPNLQQCQLRHISPRLARFHETVEFYDFMHCIEKRKQCQITNTNRSTPSAIMSS